MHEGTMVTTYTITSSSQPHCGGTWTLSSKVRETLGSALDHVNAMFPDYPREVTAGGTVGRSSFRYASEAATTTGVRAHDMVIIVPDTH